MVFCATVLTADLLYSLEFLVDVKDVHMFVYNIETVYAYQLFFFPLGPFMIKLQFAFANDSFHFVQLNLGLKWSVDMNIDYCLNDFSFLYVGVSCHANMKASKCSRTNAEMYAFERRLVVLPHA